MAGSLSGGSGTATLTVAAGGSRTIKARVFAPAAAHDVTIATPSDYGHSIHLVNGQVGGPIVGNQFAPALSFGWHDIRFEEDTVTNAPYGQVRIYADGTLVLGY